MTGLYVSRDLYQALLLLVPAVVSALLVSPKPWRELRRQMRAWFRMQRAKKEDRQEYKEQKKQFQKLPRKDRKERKKQIRTEWKAEKKQLRRQYDAACRQPLGRAERNEKTNVLLELMAFTGQFIVSLALYAVICIIAVSIYSGVRSYHTRLPYFVVWTNFLGSYFSANWKTVIGIPFVCAVFTRSIKSKRLKIGISVLLILTILCVSLFTSFSTQNVLPMESEILAELKRNPYPFETEFMDIEGFRSRVDRGYHAGDAENDGGTGTDGHNEKSRPDELDLDINSLSLHQLLKCIYYLQVTDFDLCKVYVQRAYELCQATEQKDRFDVGEMWYYHGICTQDEDSFINAANEFISVERYWNATGSLWRHYKLFEDAYTHFDAFLDAALQAIEKGQADRTISYCEDYYQKLNDFATEPPYFDGLNQLCTIAPDNAFLNIMAITGRIANHTILDEDKAEVEHLLSLKDYASCPKLLLLRHYYGGDELNRLYQLYVEAPELFEAEDRINLALLFQEKGEYQAAFSILQDQPGEIAVKAEAYLCGGLQVDQEKLYYDVKRLTEESKYDHRGYWARLELIRLIMETRLGLEPAYSGLSAACREVFDSGSTTGLFIIASLENEDGKYVECANHCVEILKETSPPDELYYRVLFLRADALMDFAASPGGRDQRDKLYLEAEQILTGIQETVGSNYVMCLERLEKLYLAIGNETEYQRVYETLSTIRGVR